MRELSARQIQILRLLWSGTPKEEIKLRLGLAESTYRNTLHDAYRRFDTSSQLGLIRQAIALKLISSDDPSTPPPPRVVAARKAPRMSDDWLLLFVNTLRAILYPYSDGLAERLDARHNLELWDKYCAGGQKSVDRKLPGV